MSCMRRRNIDKLIIIIYVVDLSTFNKFLSSTFNDDSNLFEKDKHAHVQTFFLISSFIFLFSISLVSFSLFRFKYDDYDLNVNMIEKTKHDTRIFAKDFSHEKTKHDTKIFAKDFNHEKTKHDTKIYAKNFNHEKMKHDTKISAKDFKHSQKHEF